MVVEAVAFGVFVLICVVLIAAQKVASDKKIEETKRHYELIRETRRLQHELELKEIERHYELIKEIRRLQ